LFNTNLNYTDLLGIPFKMGGRTKQEGFDCYGLCMEVAKRAGVTPYEFNIGIEDLHKRSDAINNGKESCIEIDKPEPFCIVTFKIRPPYVTHMGIVLEDCKSFIHILKKRSVSIARLDEPIWKRKIDGFYRYDQ